MGTLPSSSVVTLSVRFRALPAGSRVDGRIRPAWDQRRRMIGSRWARSLRRERPRVVLPGRRWGAITCCALNGDEGEDKNLSSSSPSTSASTSTEEPERRSADDLRSEQTPASVSPRVCLSSPTEPWIFSVIRR